jgi:hypothetical protein
VTDSARKAISRVSADSQNEPLAAAEGDSEADQDAVDEKVDSDGH